MRATSIPAHEQSFFDNKTDSNGKKFNLQAQQLSYGQNKVLNYTTCKRINGDESFFYKQEFSKKKIVLHYTAGYLKGDVATLTQPTHEVSVPFIIARNGTILNLWSSKYWAYHLGPGASGGNTDMSKESIGIEISNIGSLREISGNLVTEYSNTDVYCTPANTSYYVKPASAYRGKTCFATFTDEQYASLNSLIDYLCNKFGISKTILPESDRYNIMTDAFVRSYNGILSHVNFRMDKWDIAPGFDWSRIL